jgi:hypothetical protein
MRIIDIPLQDLTDEYWRQWAREVPEKLAGPDQPADAEELGEAAGPVQLSF